MYAWISTTVGNSLKYSNTKEVRSKTVSRCNLPVSSESLSELSLVKVTTLLSVELREDVKEVSDTESIVLFGDAHLELHVGSGDLKLVLVLLVVVPVLLVVSLLIGLSLLECL